MARIFYVYVFVFLCSLQCGSTEKLDNSVNKLLSEEGTDRKSTTMFDYHTVSRKRMTAYKDLVGSGCYIEFIKNGESSLSQRIREFPSKKLPEELYISEEKLSKRRIWELAGPRIWEFCRGFPTYLIQEVKNRNLEDNFIDSNDIVKKRIRRRSTSHYFVGRLRGQTQSQYLNFGGPSNDSSGKAEAESAFGGSRATVVGTNGMGQAQSQTITNNCDECYGPEKTSAYGSFGYPSDTSNFEGQPRQREQIPYRSQEASRQQPGDERNLSELNRLRPGGFDSSKSGGRDRIFPSSTGETYPSSKMPQKPSDGAFSNRPEEFSPHTLARGQEPQRPNKLYPGTIQTVSQGKQAVGPSGQDGVFTYPVGSTFESPISSNVGINDALGTPGLQSVGFSHGSEREPYPQSRKKVPVTDSDSPKPGILRHPQGPSYQNGVPSESTAIHDKFNAPEYYPLGSQYPSDFTNTHRTGYPGKSFGPTKQMQPVSQIDLNQDDNTVHSQQSHETGTQQGISSYPSKPSYHTNPNYTGESGYRIPIGLETHHRSPGIQREPYEGISNSGSFSGHFSGVFDLNGHRVPQGGKIPLFGNEDYSRQNEPARPQLDIDTQGQLKPSTVIDRTQYGPGTFNGRNRYQPTINNRFQPGTTEENQPSVSSYQDVNQSRGQGQYQPGATNNRAIHQPSRGHYGPGTIDSLGQYQPPTVIGQGHYPVGLADDRSQYQPSMSGNSEYYPKGQSDDRRQNRPSSINSQERYRPGISSEQYQPSPGTDQSHFQPGRFDEDRPYVSAGNKHHPGIPGVGNGQGQYVPLQSSGPDNILSENDNERNSRPYHSVGSHQPETPGSNIQQKPTPEYDQGHFHQQYQPSINDGHTGLQPGKYSQRGQYSPIPSDVKYQPEKSGTLGPYIPQTNVEQGNYQQTVTDGLASRGRERYPDPVEKDRQQIDLQRPGSNVKHNSYPTPGETSHGKYQPGLNYAEGEYKPQNIPQLDGEQPVPQAHQTYGPTKSILSSDTENDSRRVDISGGLGSLEPQYNRTVVSEEGNSQVQASVQQNHNLTEASAQAQGSLGKSTSQSQVSGSYSGSGSFSASAGSDDGERGALTQVSGGKQGATSTAEGHGGSGNSQAQMQIFSDTGRILSASQSSGISHNSQTQVQGGDEGGMANAQSNGSGQTSSQAQIGFTPYNKNQQNDDQNDPFVGGGTATAQGGSNFGQSQSQIQGKFRYGIKYSGAAQAQSGNGEKKNITFNSLKPTLSMMPFPKMSDSLSIVVNETTENGDNDRNTKEKLNESSMRTRSNDNSQQTSRTIRDEDDEEYDYEENDTEKPSTRRLITQTRGGQTQHILLPDMRNLDARVLQSPSRDYLEPGIIFQPGESIPGTSGFTIPNGFRGRVKSVAGTAGTYALGRHSQAQSVTITPGTGRIVYEKDLPKLKNEDSFYRSLDNNQFVSFSKSETGYDNPLTGKRVSSTHYTQSSTCGLVTTTCVFRNSQRICLPNISRDPNGPIVIC